MPIESIVTSVILFIVVVAVYYIISIWIYKRAPSNMAFIRTGLFGTKVCLGRGAIVLPVFHEVTWVSLETIKVIVSRSREQAILTKDKIRIDVTAELYAHVGPTKQEILVASRSLGEKTFDPDKVRNLLEAKVVSALRSHAATRTLAELHENRDPFAKQIKANVLESFTSNGLVLEEVTVVALEQTAKEFFRTDNVFDAEGLKIITEITSAAKREVHNTEKRTAVAIRKRDLDTQVELLELERQEAFARAAQDKSISNEQALQLGEKQIYILEQRLAVEAKEIGNERSLEQFRTERDLALTEELRKREVAQIQKQLALEREEKDRQIKLLAKQQEEELVSIRRNLARESAEKDRIIALVAKQQEEELANIRRNLARESAEKDREIELIAKERERQQADIARVTAVTGMEEKARNERHKVAEETVLALRKRSLDTRLAVLDLDQAEAVAVVAQEQHVATEQARILSEKQRFILEQRWQVEQEELAKALLLEKARIQKDIAVSEELKKREASEIRRALAREQEERNRQIALVGKAEELERAEVQRRLAVDAAERDREIALVAKEEALERARVRMALAVETEQRDRDIALIAKEQQREQADIRRFLAREQEERDRQIALVAKTKHLEQAEIDRLKVTAQLQRSEHDVESVRILADAGRHRDVELIHADTLAKAKRVDEENKANITRLHMVTQAEARRQAAQQEAEATVIRAKANSEAQQVVALGIEKEAGAKGRADVEIEALRNRTVQGRLEAEAAGMRAKAEALRHYNDSATFMELARLHIESERDVHIDQAKAMGSALSNAEIRMYGGDGGPGGTVDTIRGLFTKGFGLGEVLDGIAHSLPQGLRERFAKNGLRGIFGRPYQVGNLKPALDQLGMLVRRTLNAKQVKELPFHEAAALLEQQAGADNTMVDALGLLRDMNQQGLFGDLPFEKVWALVQELTKKDH
jgi:uncharacterized membrane protein YqiK